MTSNIRTRPWDSRRVEVIAPSGYSDPDKLARGIQYLETLGYAVRSHVPDTGWSRFSDTDDGRLAQIHAAAVSDSDAVIISRGGYGLSCLLDRIDWDLIARSVRRGTQWFGYSDFTALQIGLLAKTGAPSWAGPALSGDFGADTPDSYMQAQFECVLSGKAPIIDWLSPSPHPRYQVEPLEGTLWGGNLSMLTSLIGTEWFPRIEQGILFVEDVAEHPYRVERMLLQMLFCGALSKQKAILFGHFNGWKSSPLDNGFCMDTVAEHLTQKLGFPVIQGLPFGHTEHRATLGIGRTYRLGFDSDTQSWCLSPKD